MSDELLIQEQLRKKIMEIAESLIPLFKSLKLDESGNVARFVSVKNIEFLFHNYGEIFEYETTIEFLSDQGSWMESVIIREFNNPDLFQNEIETYKKLEERCMFSSNVQPIAVLVTDDENSRIIYKGSEGTHIHKMDIPTELEDFQLGFLSAMLQGSTVKEMNVDDLKSLIEYLMSQLPFKEQMLEIIADLFEPIFENLENSKGGYSGGSVFDPAFIKFTPLLPLDQIDKSNISKSEAFEINIIPFQQSESLSDRMVDLVTCFGDVAYIEYYETKGVIETKSRVLNFLEGYELAYDKVGLIPFDEIYPHGLTLDFYMLVSYWLRIFHKQHPRQSSFEATDEKIVQYTFFLLEYQPFKRYED